MEVEGKKPVFFKGNEISFGTNHLYVGIRLINANPAYFCLKVVDSEMKEREYSFYTIEEAVYFKNKINRCYTLEQVDNLYNKLLAVDEESKERIPTPRIRIQGNRISLTTDDINNAIVNYYGEGRNNKVEANEELTVHDGTLYIRFFVSRYFEDDVETKILRSELHADELKHILNDLIKHENYEVDSFQCLGGILESEDDSTKSTPYFDGIEVYLKERKKPKKLNMNKHYGIFE